MFRPGLSVPNKLNCLGFPGARVLLGLAAFLLMHLGSPGRLNAQQCQSDPTQPAQIQSFTITGNIIGESTQDATGTVTLTCAPSTNVTPNFSSPCSLGGSGGTIPAGSTTGTVTFNSQQVAQTTMCTVTASLNNGSSAQATVEVDPLTPFVTVSPSNIVGESTDIATFTLTINAPMVGPNPNGSGSFNVSNDSAGVLSGPGPVAIQEFATSTTFTMRASQLNQTMTYTVTVTNQIGGPSAQTSLTVVPLTPTLTDSPSSILGGTGQSSSFTITLNAPADGVFGSVPYVISSTPINLQVSGSTNVPNGSTSVTFTATAGSVSQATPVTVTASPNAGGPSASTALTVCPAGGCIIGSPDLGPVKACIRSCGSPINLTTGNTWIQERDYSLPGLGGGLELTRTWNSLWQSTFPVSVSGMFGNSWRSTYEELLSIASSSTIIYWRADGSAWTFTYNSGTSTYYLTSPPDERGQIVANQPAAGQFTLTFADGSQRIFGTNDLLASIIDRNGNQTTVTYGGSNRITQVTDPAGRTLSFTYGNSSFPNLATSAQDAVGTVATYSYDGSGRLTQVVYADASSANFAYDTNSLITSVTDAQAKLLESHTYDSQFRGLTSTRADNADSVTVTYTSSTETALSDSMGNTTTYVFGAIGGRNFITSVAGPGCSSCGGRGNQTLTYDSLGNVSSSTDALGRTTNFTYDSNGNVLTRSIQLNSSTTLTWTYTYNSFQEVLTANDPMGNTTTNTYDSKGNLLSTTTPPPSGSGSGLTTSFTYDSKGELAKVTDPRNNSTTMAYNSVGLISSVTDAQNNVTSFAYDGRGNRTSSTDALNNTTAFAYDVMNRLTGITQPGNVTTSFTYDTRGRRTGVTDANNKTTTYAYDDADRLLGVTDAASNETIYGYDTENHLASITDALSRVTNFSYDALGRVTGVTFPSTLSESYTYDAVGNLLTKEDRKNQTISYAYDNLDRLTIKTFPDTTAVTYTYDNDSRLTQAADPTGTYSFSYDHIGRLLGTTTSYSFLNRTLTESYSYDAASNRASFTDPEGGLTSYAYDTLNRLTGLTDFSRGNSTFSYDALGRRTNLARPNGVTTSYSYDTLSRLLQVLHQNGSSLVESMAYTYDAAGNRLSQTETTPGRHGNVTKAATFSYDAIYELTQAVTNGSTTDADTYDAVGNRLTDVFGGTYTYNSSNELTAYPSYSWTYDANGNTTGKTVTGTGTTSYTWDFENRLTSVALPGTGGTVTFKYDPFGRRIYKSSSSGTTIYAYDGDNRIEDLNSSGTATARYTDGLAIDEPLEVFEGNASYYYHADGLGSISALTKRNGSVANSYQYDTFGGQGFTSETVTNPFQFTARERDSEISLYYYRARYYDPLFGRFLSEDPITFDAHVNFYAYLGNDPTAFVDPTGLQGREAGSQEPSPGPLYNPAPWSDPGKPPGTGTQYQNNCYSYACDRLYPPGDHPHAPQPGEASGHQWSRLSCKNIRAAAVRDGLKNAPGAGCCPQGYHKVVLFIGSNVHPPGGPNLGPDYHWYRQDSNGLWSSKHGLTPVGPQVSDPKKDAKSWGYNTDCGELCAPNQW